MTLKDWLLPEFDHEMAITRRLLERVHLLAQTLGRGSRKGPYR